VNIKNRITIVTLTLSLFAGNTASAAKVMMPSPPQISASSYILMEVNTGRVIAEGNANEKLPPASLTKMMTAYMVDSELGSGRMEMDELVPISVKAWKTGGSRMFIQEGTQVSVSDLLKGIVIQSGNDASVAIAEHIAGSEDAFVDVMNQKAVMLGMKNTQFQTSTGLPHSDQYSSARDMAILGSAIINDYPENYHLHSQKYFTYNNIQQYNRNKLLWSDTTVDGLKTGYTAEAGYCLVASSKRGETRMIAVVFGARSPTSRAKEVQKLLSYGFRYYETTKVAEGSKGLVENKVWAGKSEEVTLGIDKDIMLTLARGEKEEITTEINLPDAIKAPVAIGEALGTFRVILDGKVIEERPIVALNSVEKAGLFKSLWDSLCLFMISLFG
jgi:D-alanyl-D-alanine carboxypeptidase (penicillin-binding protein 5/6)